MCPFLCYVQHYFDHITLKDLKYCAHMDHLDDIFIILLILQFWSLTGLVIRAARKKNQFYVPQKKVSHGLERKW